MMHIIFNITQYYNGVHVLRQDYQVNNVDQERRASRSVPGETVSDGAVFHGDLNARL